MNYSGTRFPDSRFDAYAGDDPVNEFDPTGLGRIPSWAQTAWNDTGGKAISAVNTAADDTGHFLSDPSRWRAEADYGAGIANAIVSTVTLGQIHISTPYCDVPGWVSDLGNGVGFAPTAVGGGEAVDALRSIITSGRVVEGGAAIVLNIGGEGEVPGAINVQYEGALTSDWGAGRLDVSGKSLTEVAANGDPYVVASNGALPFPDSSVDQVVTNSVRIGGQNAAGQLYPQQSEIWRVLKPEGEWLHDGTIQQGP